MLSYIKKDLPGGKKKKKSEYTALKHEPFFVPQTLT